jgi:hypothetical protein
MGASIAQRGVGGIFSTAIEHLGEGAVKCCNIMLLVNQLLATCWLRCGDGGGCSILSLIMAPQVVVFFVSYAAGLNAVGKRTCNCAILAQRAFLMAIRQPLTVVQAD